MGDYQNSSASANEGLKLINLLKGWPNPSFLPTDALAKASQTALSDPAISTPGLLYGPDPGYQPLREEIAIWLSDFYSDPSTGQAQPETPPSPAADRICITGGASQNLACVLQVFTDPLVTRVWMVAPCYFLACRIFEDSGLRLGAVPEGEHGIDLEWLERVILEAEKEDGIVKPLKTPQPWAKFYKHVIYLVPTFSNPSGKTMPLQQRQKLVQLARKYDALIITDDVYDVLQWSTTSQASSSSLFKAPVPRLVDVDRTLEPIPASESFGNAISNGSFSKIVGPGVRTGWAEATPKFTFGLSQCGSSRSGGAPSQLVATMISQLLKTGALQDHVQKTLCPAYQKRSSLLLSAIREHLLPIGVSVGEVSFGPNNTFGGYFVWLELPKHLSATVVAEYAKTEWKLIISPGYAFEVNGDERVRFENSIRLCFAWVEEADLTEGIRRLKEAIQGVERGDKRVLDGGDNLENKQNLGEFQ